VLLEPLARRIAKALKLEKPAHEAPICLSCHTDDVPPNMRGAKFNLEDGVGCESCHGGSERWLADHDDGRSHRENLEDGLYPTDDPIARAELCLSCHFGTSDRFVDHRLLSAGHPRQSFELHLFTQILPPHFVVDDDYRKRGKHVPGALRTWAIGQAIAVREVLEALLDPRRSREGAWPEFVLFDCHACHHPMSEQQWRPRPSTGLPAGVARLQDSNFLMLGHALSVADPKAAGLLAGDLRDLHAAASLGVGNIQTVAGRALTRMPGVIGRLRAWNPDAAALRKVAIRITSSAARAEYVDYASAEQAAMACQDMVDGLYTLGALRGDALEGVSNEIRLLLDATRDPEAFDPASAAKALRRLGSLLR
jgi:hypothetical protein